MKIVTGKIFKIKLISIWEILFAFFTINKKRNRVILHLTGLLALLWFLIRVIPKPSRALYPCQRAAFPAASAFVIWVMGLAVSLLSFKKAKKYLKASKYAASVLFIFAGIIIFAISQSGISYQELFANTDEHLVLNDSKEDSTVVQPEAVVSIVRSAKANAEDIDSVEIYDMVRQAVQMAGGFDQLIKDSMVVVLKPNLLMPYVVNDNLDPQRVLPEKINSVTTDYRVIQGVVNLVRERNPHGKIYIIEGSAVGNIRDNMEKMGWFKITGVDKIYPLDEICGSWRDRNAQELVKVSLPAGKNLYTGANNEYYLNKIYYEADVLISIPVLKTHSNCAVTGAVKNVGIGATPVNIYGSSTSHPWRFDVIGHTGGNYSVLHDWVHDFYMCRPVDYAVMDALTGMQNGPSPGINDPTSLAKKNTRCIIASKDPIAMDAIESLIIQVDPSKVRHLVKLHNDSLGCADPRYIRVKGIRVDEIKDHYSNLASYARYTDFSAPDVTVSSYQISGDSLNIALNSSADLTKVEVAVNDNNPGMIYTGNFDNIKIKTGASITDPQQVKIFAYDRFLNCTILQLPATGIKYGNKTRCYELMQNYPNPFNPTTNFGFRIPATADGSDPGLVTLKVFDLQGREITTLVNEEKPAGEYEIKFNAANLSSGVYFYELKAGNSRITNKMVLLR